jgi:hypothetical protein
MTTRSAADRAVMMASQAPDVLQPVALAALKVRPQRRPLQARLPHPVQPSVYALPSQENKDAATSTQKIS